MLTPATPDNRTSITNRGENRIVLHNNLGPTGHSRSNDGSGEHPMEQANSARHSMDALRSGADFSYHNSENITPINRTPVYPSNRKHYRSRRLNQLRTRQRARSRQSQLPFAPPRDQCYQPPKYSGIPMDQDFGDPLGPKLPTHARIVFGNINGFTEAQTRNPKVAALKQFFRNSEVDCFGGAEPNINWSAMKRHENPREWFRSENALRVVAAHNTHQNVSTIQQGGAIMACFGEMAKRLVETGKDPNGLGRWAWFKFIGKEQHTTRIVTAYIPCPGPRTGLRTVYAQQQQYWEKRRNYTCPKVLLIQQLTAQLHQWRAAGDRIMLLIDANGDVRTCDLAKRLAETGLEMQEVIQARHHALPTTPSHQSGSKPIDGIFTTPDLPIQKGALLALDKQLGDHRFAYVDINWSTLLGEDIHRIIRPDARRLNSKLPDATRKYNTLLTGMLKKEEYRERVYAIQQSAGPKLTDLQQTTLIQLDDLRKESMLYSERHCRKLNMGKVDFSPQISDARNAVELWRSVSKRKSGGKVSSSLIKRLAKKCKVAHPFSVSAEQSKQLHQQAKDHYFRIKPLAQNLRHEFLRYRATDTSISEESRRAAGRLIRQEQQREAAAAIRHALGTTRGGSVRQVTTTDDNGVATLHTEETAVIQAIMTTNEARFRLTETTPPMTEPLRTQLGFLGTTEAAQQILDGTYIAPPDLDPWTAHFLDQLRRLRDSDSEIDTTISAEDYKQFWKSSRERTASSFSGLHFGHWKAAAQSDYLSECHAITTELAYASGFSLPRWQVGLSVMLEKVPGNSLAEKLRAILLMEADFNFANRLFFNVRMMQKAEQSGQLPEELYGGRNGHEAQEVAVNRRITADIARQSRMPIAIASVDAQSCYDRISHSIASICCQRWGVGANLLTTMLTTIQQMQYHLRTAFGDSVETYGGSLEEPFQGACQGNPAAGALWLAVSSALVTAQHNQGHVATFEGAINKVVTTLAGLLFVDDVDLISFSQNQGISPESIVTRLQEQVNTWQANLWTTGGALQPAKCSYSIAAFGWKNGKHYYHTATSFPTPPLTITGANGQKVPLARLEVNDPVTVVGVVQAMDGSMKGQYEAIREKTSRLGGKMRECHLLQKDAWVALRATAWPSIKYPLPATVFTRDEGHSLMVPLTKHLLPKLGVNQHMPCAYRYAPASMQGLGIPHPYIEQGIEHIKHLTTHNKADTDSGKLLITTLDYLQLEIGTRQPVLSASFRLFGHLATPSWIKCLWQFVDSAGISLAAPNHIKIPKASRHNDSFLNDIVSAQQLFSPPQLAAFNRVRLFYRVITLADISTGDGLYIRDEFLVGSDRNNDFRSDYKWQIEHPQPSDYRTWRKGLNSLCNTPRHLRPEHRLGSWNNDDHHVSQWPWYFDAATRSLFFNNGGVEFLRYEPTRQQPVRSGTNFRISGMVDSLPATVQRATAQRFPNIHLVRFDGAATQVSQQTAPSVPQSIEEMKANTNWWPLQNGSFPHNRADIVRAIIDGTALGVCDGSYMPNQSDSLGAAAWIIEDPATGTACHGTCQTSGEPVEVNAYRSELQGMHATLLAVLLICTLNNIRSGAVTIGCDNQTAINLSQAQWRRVQWKVKHTDLIRAIHTVRKQIEERGVALIFTHVRGHQDDACCLSQLPRIVQLNIEMDRNAKERLLDMITEPTACQQETFGEGWAITIEGRKLTVDPANIVRRHILGKELRDFQITRGRMTMDAFNFINWEGLEEATKTMPTMFNLWMSKHVSSFCAVNNQLHYRDETQSKACPHCPHLNETAQHLVECPAPEMTKQWTASLDGLAAWFEESQTHPDIASCFLGALRTRNTSSFLDHAKDTIVPAATEQDEIGYINTTEGKISKQWTAVQQNHYNDISSRRTARVWTRGFIYHLLALTHSQWTQRNDKVHERAANGLLVDEADQLAQAIREHFASGTAGLLAHHKYYIQHWSLQEVLAFRGQDQLIWRQGIETAKLIAEEERNRERTGMQGIMGRFLGLEQQEESLQDTNIRDLQRENEKQLHAQQQRDELP